MPYDEYQREAINHKDGPCLVLAPAGSGKTSVLIQRIITLIDSGTDPENILVLTFSKKACEEMKSRLSNKALEHYSDVDIYTYHALAFKYEGTGRKLAKTDDFQKILLKIKKEFKISVSIKQLEYKILIGSSLSEDESLFLNILCNALKKSSLFLYNIMLYEFYTHLQKEPTFLSELQDAYKYLLVDECQDNNAIQYEITKLISGDCQNTFLVGDDDQTIYSFMGSDVENFLRIEKDFVNLKKIILNYNYRSAVDIISCSKKLISNNNARTDKNILSGKNISLPENSVRHFSFDTVRDVNFYIVNTCISNMGQGIQTAILYRNKYYAHSIMTALSRKNMNFYVRDPFDLNSIQEIRFLHSMLCCLCDAGNIQNWYEVFKYLFPYIKDHDIFNILKNQYDVDLYNNIYSFIYSDEHTGSTHTLILEREKDFLAGFNNLREKLQPVNSLIQKIEIILEAYPELINDISSENTEALNAYKSFAKTSQDLSALAASMNITRTSQNSNPSTDKNLSGDEAYDILLYTIHSSKGKEFDHVLLIGLEEGILPDKKCIKAHVTDNNDTSYNKDINIFIEEERRLCYVGMTRAIHKLDIIYCKEAGKCSCFFTESLIV